VVGNIIDAAFSAVIVYVKVFAIVSYTGLNNSITAVSNSPVSVFSTIKASFGSPAEKLFGPAVQLPTKSEVLTVSTILLGRSENVIVLFDTLSNSSV
jgi:hypothetical protein